MRHALCASLAALACGTASANIDIYSVALYGANECAGNPPVCGVGDPDGWGAGTVMIDHDTAAVSWQLLAFDIVFPLSGAHIHAAPAGSNGPVIIDLLGLLSGLVVDSDALSITPSNAGDFYVNLHNADHPGGAIRGQLVYERTVTPIPEPGTTAMLLGGLAVLGWIARRRRD